jgi:hypothetical protein
VTKEQPRPNSICSISRKEILGGVGRLRRGLTSVHLGCQDSQPNHQPKKRQPKQLDPKGET